MSCLWAQHVSSEAPEHNTTLLGEIWNRSLWDDEIQHNSDKYNTMQRHCQGYIQLHYECFVYILSATQLSLGNNIVLYFAVVLYKINSGGILVLACMHVCVTDHTCQKKEKMCSIT